MAITKPSVGHPTKKQAFADAVIDELAALGNQVSFSEFIANGSFENDADSDGIPDGWAFTSAGAGGTFALDTDAADVAHAAKSALFTNASGAGGFLQMSDYIPCASLRPITFSWLMKSSSATVRNKFEVRWYDRAKAFLSMSTLYDKSTGNPTSYRAFFAVGTPPANARFAQVRITGADSATTGSTHFDDVKVVAEGEHGLSFHTADGSFVVPDNVFRVRIRAWGGGGGGGGGGTLGATVGGGGGGGAYAEAFATVTPGETLTIDIGAGGPAGISSGGNGTDGTAGSATTVTGGGGTLISAGGGGLGQGSNNGSAGGAGGTSANTVNITGQAGSTGTGAGNSGEGGSAGLGTGPTIKPGINAGTSPGGGGAGSSGNGVAGAAGASGRVIIQY